MSAAIFDNDECRLRYLCRKQARSSGSNSSSGRTYYRTGIYSEARRWRMAHHGFQQSNAERVAMFKGHSAIERQIIQRFFFKAHNQKSRKKEGFDKTVIHWQNKVTWGQPTCFYWPSALFFWAFFLRSSHFDTGGGGLMFSFVVLGFILTVSAFVMFSGWNQLKMPPHVMPCQLIIPIWSITSLQNQTDRWRTKGIAARHDSQYQLYVRAIAPISKMPGLKY